MGARLLSRVDSSKEGRLARAILMLLCWPSPLFA